MGNENNLSIQSKINKTFMKALGNEGGWQHTKNTQLVEAVNRLHPNQFSSKQITQLLEEGSDPAYGLKAAIKKGLPLETLKIFLDKGADPTKVCEANGLEGSWSSMSEAGIQGNIKGLATLWDYVDKNPQFKLDEKEMNWILYHSSWSKTNDVTSYAIDRLENGANSFSPEAKQRLKNDALKEALKHQNIKMVPALKEKGAMLSFEDAIQSNSVPFMKIRSQQGQNGAKLYTDAQTTFIDTLDAYTKNGAELTQAQKNLALKKAIDLGGDANLTKRVLAMGAVPTQGNLEAAASWTNLSLPITQALMSHPYIRKHPEIISNVYNYALKEAQRTPPDRVNAESLEILNFLKKEGDAMDIVGLEAYDRRQYRPTPIYSIPGMPAIN